MKEVTVEELRRRLESGEALTVVDIREANEFTGWHIAGSRNVPVYNALREGRVEPLIERATDLPMDRPIVAVCRMGVVSRKAAAVLDTLGYDAASLSDGMRGWGGVWSESRVEGRLDPSATFVQVRRLGKGCLSYLLGSPGQAFVVDPCVDIAAYVRIAEREQLRITHVLETHVHADHVSRARALCEATGATLCMPRNDRVRFEYRPLQDGETLEVGGLGIEVVNTPGHTGESVCYLVEGTALLTGDTLFLGAVGRPDLERGDAGAEAGARLLHRSLARIRGERFRDVWIYPAHHGEPIPFDRSPIAARMQALAERLPLLQAPEDRFVTAVLGSLRDKPPNYDQVLAVNEGRAGLGRQSPLDLEAGPNRCAAG